MTRALEALGRAFLLFLNRLGRMAVFLGWAAVSAFSPPLRLRLIIKRAYFIGVRSLSVIVLTGLFTGMVLGLQGYYALRKFGSEALLGPAVALSLIRELGPVLSALMVTGRAGSALAAEIGIMQITEQIDALYIMAVDPMKYLITPIILAGLLTFPLLTAIFNVIGIYGGYLIGVKLLGISSGTYFSEMRSAVELYDVWVGVYKSLVFGVLVTWVACYKGYYTRHGAEGVSRATTEAVVLSSVLILIGDYVLTSILF